jgi:glycerophosphoryl diester phosphodiesterase
MLVEAWMKRCFALSGLAWTIVSVTAAEPSTVSAEEPVVVAQRGVHPLLAQDQTCTARRVLRRSADLIENTLPSIAAAFESGAGIVEMDIQRSKDDQFVLFHDATLDCRTNGSGPVSSKTVQELKALDMGYGYSVDEGRTFYLRGHGIGLMPTLDEVLRRFPTQRLMLQFKSNDPYDADVLMEHLSRRGARDWSRLIFFGGERPTKRLKELWPNAVVWTDKQAAVCTKLYIAAAASAPIPDECKEGVIVTPTNLLGMIPGWPEPFLHRMKAAKVTVLAIGRLERGDATEFSRLDDPDELARLPADFQGMIWTDRVDVIGPLVRKNVSIAIRPRH